MDKHQEIYLMCKVLLWIFFPIFWGTARRTTKVQQIAAVASDIASAAYTPVTPIKCGNINASGINSIALRNKAMKIEIFACPKATNIFWQARCNPKIVIPPKKTGIVQRTVSISLSSLVNAEATVEGKES